MSLKIYFNQCESALCTDVQSSDYNLKKVSTFASIVTWWFFSYFLLSNWKVLNDAIWKICESKGKKCENMLSELYTSDFSCRYQFQKNEFSTQ